MMFYTHLAFGLLCSLLSLKYLPGISNKYIFILLVCLISIVPDIDEAGSKLGKKLWFIAKLFSHRGFLHSIYPPILLFLLFNYVFHSSLIAFAILIGYFSHLILDALTVSGINFLNPILTFRVSGFIKTGSIFEILLFLALLGLDVFYIFKLIV
ncbi:MAG: metal-dependent hydrolase [Candidatus Nanoarchaeia archaeon]|nr:metal-dependent hydrolase [Candidatus Nanoarchaeia archaeon]MDD5587905.1 metal-dependent hydrolase [Candidatus Nanoarchaeia archaeon]